MAAHDTIGGETVAVENAHGEDSDTGEIETHSIPPLPTEEDLEREEANRDTEGDAGDNDGTGDATELTDAEMCDIAGLNVDVDRLETYLKEHDPRKAPGAASIIWKHFTDASLDKLWADMETEYKTAVPKVDVPGFDTVPNPAGWEHKYFKAKFKGKGKARKFTHYEHVGGARVAPVNADNKHMHGGFEYLYDGDHELPGSGRLHATHDEPMPDARVSKLSMDKLVSLDFTEKHLNDPLFFLFLILPTWLDSRGALRPHGLCTHACTKSRQ